MVKDLFLSKMDIAGDAIITYRSPVSKKLKYNVCTLELNSCDYIQEKMRNKKINDKEGCMLMFCWDTDSFRQINIEAVTRIQPLGSILRNKRYF
jgi:hypothetical protein